MNILFFFRDDLVGCKFDFNFWFLTITLLLNYRHFKFGSICIKKKKKKEKEVWLNQPPIYNELIKFMIRKY